MKLKFAAIAAAAVLAAPVFAETVVMSPSVQVVPAGSELVIPSGSSASVIVAPHVSTAMATNTAVLGAGPAVVTTPSNAVRIDINNGYMMPPGAIHRADFQRWLRLWP